MPTALYAKRLALYLGISPPVTSPRETHGPNSSQGARFPFKLSSFQLSDFSLPLFAVVRKDLVISEVAIMTPGGCADSAAPLVYPHTNSLHIR